MPVLVRKVGNSSKALLGCITDNRSCPCASSHKRREARRALRPAERPRSVGMIRLHARAAALRNSLRDMPAVSCQQECI